MWKHLMSPMVLSTALMAVPSRKATVFVVSPAYGCIAVSFFCYLLLAFSKNKNENKSTGLFSLCLSCACCCHCCVGMWVVGQGELVSSMVVVI